MATSSISFKSGLSANLSPDFNLEEDSLLIAENTLPYNAFHEAIESMKARRAYLYATVNFLINPALKKEEAENYLHQHHDYVNSMHRDIEQSRKSIISSFLKEINEIDTNLKVLQGQPLSQRLLDDFYDIKYKHFLGLTELTIFFKKKFKKNPIDLHAMARSNNFKSSIGLEFLTEDIIKILEPHISVAQRTLRSPVSVVKWVFNEEVFNKGTVIGLNTILYDYTSLKKQIVELCPNISALHLLVKPLWQTENSKRPPTDSEKLCLILIKILSSTNKQMEEMAKEFSRTRVNARDTYFSLYELNKSYNMFLILLKEALTYNEKLKIEKKEEALDNVADTLVITTISEAVDSLLIEQEKQSHQKREKELQDIQSKKMKEIIDKFQDDKLKKTAQYKESNQIERLSKQYSVLAKHLAIVNQHKEGIKATSRMPEPLIDETEAFKLLFALNSKNLNLIKNFYMKTIPSIRFNSVMELFGDPAQGKLNGYIESSRGSHKKIVIGKITGIFDGPLENLEDIDSKDEKVKQKNKSERKAVKNKPSSVLGTGGTFRKHGKKKSSMVPSVVIGQIKATLERVGINEERIELLEEFIVHFSKTDTVTIFSDFLTFVKEIRDKKLSLTPTERLAILTGNATALPAIAGSAEVLKAGESSPEFMPLLAGRKSESEESSSSTVAEVAQLPKNTKHL